MAVYSERVENCISIESSLFLVEMMVAMKYGSNNHKSLSSIAGGNEGPAGVSTSEEKSLFFYWIIIRELSEIEALLFVLEKEYNQFLIQSANVADLVKKVIVECECECDSVDGKCEETIYYIARKTRGKES